MNVIDVFQKCLVYACLAGAAVCFFAVLAYHFRDQLRELHERWLGLGPLGRVVSILAVTLAVLYGGTKSPTNDPPNTVGGDSTNPPPMMCCSPRPRLSTPPQELTTDNQQLTTLPAWHRRGAYSDWQRIDFPESFAFPHGTNLLTSITLFAYGEIRESLHQLTTNNQQLTTLPTAVSLSPGESSVTYGLTPSNSFLIAWQNACVNRDATNRVDASIELFRNGAIVITTQRPSEAPSTNYQAPITPPGFIGSNQDNDWALAAFPDDYDAITNKGYEAWLMEDKVGINEPNGLYKATITVGSLPDEGPCYLVCGPYKVVVTAPGAYSFPLEVFKTYKARTCPVALPLLISTDDGYLDGALPNLMMSVPRRMLASPPHDSPEYEIHEEPRLVISPYTIPLSQAVGTHISIWCNVTSAVRRYSSLVSREFRLNFCNPSDAEIVAAEVEDTIEIIIDAPLGTCVGTVTITDDHLCCGCGSCTGSGCTCGCDCWRHQSSNDTPTNSPPVAP